MRSKVLPLLSLALACVAGCSGGGGGGGGGGYDEVGRVEVTLIVPPQPENPDPFDTATSVRVAILDSTGGLVLEESFGIGDDIEIRSIPPGPGRTIVLEALDGGGSVLSRGRTTPVDVIEGPTQQRTLYLSRVGQLATVYGTQAARTGATSHAFSDGRVLIAGGLVGGTAVATTEIFDWENDVILPGGSMAAPKAFSRAASLGGDAVVIAGGVSDAAGAATATADVYVHTLNGVGTWEIAPPMGVARREHSLVGLGPGRALVAGGSSTAALDGPPLDTMALFQWDGANGTWTDTVETLDTPRMGAMAVELAGGQALIHGGFDANVGGGGGGNEFAQTWQVFEFTTVVVEADSGGVNTRRGWSGVAPISANQWIVFGGETGDAGAHTLLDTVELLTWTGTTVTDAGLDDLAAPQRDGLGGRVGPNEALVAGGNSALYPAQTPLATASTYDIPGDAFIPMTALPAATIGGTVIPLPDGTAFVVVDGSVRRYNP